MTVSVASNVTEMGSFTDQFHAAPRLFQKRNILNAMAGQIAGSSGYADLAAERDALQRIYEELVADADFLGKQKGTAG